MLARTVSRFTPHGRRRVVVSCLMRARVDPGTVAVLTGHSVQVMLGHYQQVTAMTAAEQAELGVLEDPDGAEATAWYHRLGRSRHRRKRQLPSDGGHDRTRT